MKGQGLYTEHRIDEILETISKNAFKIDVKTLKQIKQSVLKELKKEQSIEEILQNFTKELEECSREFIDNPNKVISGLSTCIYLPNESGSYSITVYGGKVNYDENGKDIDEKTIFDLASITKVYTFALALYLIDQGYFKEEDQIRDLDSRFENLGDYTVKDIFKMAGHIQTREYVASAANYEEALKRLETTYIANSNRTINHYVDVGFIILSKVIEKLVSEKIGMQMSFEDIMNEYLLKPWGLKETMFHPSMNQYTVAGNGNKKGLVHDPKARILGGAVGSAGMFATTEGLKELADYIFSEKNIKFTQMAGTILYPKSKQCYMGYAGIYQQHNLGLVKTFVPSEFSKGSFGHQGFTGTVAVFDPTQKIHIGILTNAIREGESKKPEKCLKFLRKYLSKVRLIILKIYVINCYYQTIHENKSVTIKTSIK